MENLGRLDIEKSEINIKADLKELKDIQNENKESFDLKLDKVLDSFSQKVLDALAWVEKFNSDKVLVGEYCKNLWEEEVLWISDIFNQLRVDNNLQTA